MVDERKDWKAIQVKLPPEIHKRFKVLAALSSDHKSIMAYAKYLIEKEVEAHADLFPGG